MPLPTDREKAEEAKERANERSTREFDIVEILCPACHEPVEYCEPNPNEYLHSETEDGYTNDRAAYEFSPADIMESDHSNPWDAVHVVPELVETDSGQELQVIAYKHDHFSEGYRAWEKQLDELKNLEKRASENQGLGDFA